jgi:hypothetical protein
MRNRFNPRLCDILQEGLLTYFNGESVPAAMIRIRGKEGYESYDGTIYYGESFQNNGKYNKKSTQLEEN